MWPLVAHMLVRPLLVEALTNLVCTRSLEPSEHAIDCVVTSLARRYGGADAHDQWHKKDVFSLASTMPRAHFYCGSGMLHMQLQQFDKMQRLADALIKKAQTTVSFSELAKCISDSGLHGYSTKGYWSLHLARILIPNFAGIHMFKKVYYTPQCCLSLMDMGEGASSITELGIRRSMPQEDVENLCWLVRRLGKYYQMQVGAFILYAVCAKHIGVMSCASPLVSRVDLAFDPLYGHSQSANAKHIGGTPCASPVVSRVALAFDHLYGHSPYFLTCDTMKFT